MSCKINPCSFISFYLDQYQIKYFWKMKKCLKFVFDRKDWCTGLHGLSRDTSAASTWKTKMCLFLQNVTLWCLYRVWLSNNLCVCVCVCVCLYVHWRYAASCVCLWRSSWLSCAFYVKPIPTLILLEERLQTQNPNLLNHWDRLLCFQALSKINDAKPDA